MQFWEPLYDITLPPGTQRQLLPHPYVLGRTSEIGIVESHRFAFYFWNHWSKTCTVIPDLVSIDWHKDLAPPMEKEQDDLDRLNLNDLREVALFCWSRMNPYNDGHILSAAWLDLIGDVYVLCKQNFPTPDSFISRSKRSHHIYAFKNPADLGSALFSRNGPGAASNQTSGKTQPSASRMPPTIFDIDLDYFTESEEFQGGGTSVILDDDKSIAELLDPASAWMQPILHTLTGMTIATEPRFCGGYVSAFQLLKTVSSALFYPPLLHEGCRWKLKGTENMNQNG